MHSGVVLVDWLRGVAIISGTRRELRQLLEQVAARRLRSVIHSRYPLEAAAEAHREMEERRQFGKLLLIP